MVLPRLPGEQLARVGSGDSGQGALFRRLATWRGIARQAAAGPGGAMSDLALYDGLLARA